MPGLRPCRGWGWQSWRRGPAARCPLAAAGCGTGEAGFWVFAAAGSEAPQDKAFGSPRSRRGQLRVLVPEAPWPCRCRLPSSSAVHETPSLLFSPSALKTASLMVQGRFPAEPAHAAGAPCKPQQGQGFTGRPRYFPDSPNPFSRSWRGCPGRRRAWIPKGLRI